MKNILSLSAGVLLALSLHSCQKANDPEAEARNMRVMDSTVNARLNFTRDSLMRECQMSVMEMAAYRADSIIAAKSGKAPSTSKPKPSPVTTPTTTTDNNQGTGKLKDKAEQQGGGKLKDKAGVGDTTRKTGGKLKDRQP